MRWGDTQRRPRPSPRALLALRIMVGAWLALVLALSVWGEVRGQVSTEATLGPDGTGRILVENGRTAPLRFRVRLWESDEEAPDGVELTRRVPGALVYPAEGRLPPGGRQVVRVFVPVDSLGYTPGRLLRVETVLEPPKDPPAKGADTGVRTRLRVVTRYVTKLKVGEPR